MTASSICELLRLRHANDVFLPECLTADGGSIRLDGWAMKKSWAHPVTTGYEIKVSRGDWLRDEKWHSYLEYCSDFYVVCPSGLIAPDEVAAPAGLMWVAKTGNMLITKRKAARRQVVIPEKFWRSVVMRQSGWNPQESNADFWARWVREKEAKLDVGHRVARRLRETISKKIDEVSCENIRLRRENEGLAETKAIMDKMGITPGYNVEAQLKKRMEQVFTSDFAWALKRARESIDQVLKHNPTNEN